LLRGCLRHAMGYLGCLGCILWQEWLRLSSKVDECKPLPPAHSGGTCSGTPGALRAAGAVCRARTTRAPLGRGPPPPLAVAREKGGTRVLRSVRDQRCEYDRNIRTSQSADNRHLGWEQGDTRTTKVGARLIRTSVRGNLHRASLARSYKSTVSSNSSGGHKINIQGTP